MGKGSGVVDGLHAEAACGYGIFRVARGQSAESVAMNRLSSARMAMEAIMVKEGGKGAVS
jgi:hypothetical protein